MSRPDSSRKLSPEEQTYKAQVEQRLEQEHGPGWLEANRERLDLEWEAFLDSGLL